MCIEPKNFYSYFIDLPIGAVHLAIYSDNVSCIRQLIKKIIPSFMFLDISNLDNPITTYTINNSYITFLANEVYHLGNSLEEAIHNYPHLFV